jgi:hypothetical protein
MKPGSVFGFDKDSVELSTALHQIIPEYLTVVQQTPLYFIVIIIGSRKFSPVSTKSKPSEVFWVQKINNGCAFCIQTCLHSQISFVSRGRLLRRHFLWNMLPYLHQ